MKVHVQFAKLFVHIFLLQRKKIYKNIMHVCTHMCVHYIGFTLYSNVTWVTIKLLIENKQSEQTLKYINIFILSFENSHKKNGFLFSSLVKRSGIHYREHGSDGIEKVCLSHVIASRR